MTFDDAAEVRRRSVRGVAVDVGQTGTRAERWSNGSVEHHRFDVTAQPRTAETIREVGRALSGLVSTGDHVEISLSGFRNDDDEAEAVDELGRVWSADRIGVTWDAEASHVGAFGGGHGTCTIWGTGVVTVAVGQRGMVSVGGQGFLLGDEGGGSWIGHTGLRTAVRRSEAGTAGTVLCERFRERYGSHAQAHRLLAAASNPVSVVAEFARDVLDAADAGDDDARAIRSSAVDFVVECSLTAADLAGAAADPDVLTGGIAQANSTQVAEFTAANRRLAAAASVSVCPDASIRGARFLLGDPELTWTMNRRNRWNH